MTTIREHLDHAASQILKKAEGRDFNEKETDFLHLLRSLAQYQMIASFYRSQGIQS